ncbi:MAG: S41 family peptidase [Candidatus Limnocylindria bacterium]
MPEFSPSPTPETAPPASARGGTTVAWVVSLMLAAVVGALLFLGGYLAAGGGGAGGTSCAAPAEEFAAFCEAYDRLKAEHVDELDDTKLAEGAIRGMFQYGVEDPYSGYMAPEEYQRALGDLSGKFSGIGAEMAIKNLDDPSDLAACDQFTATCVFVVVAPLAGTPAEAAGLQAGDVVTAVDGDSVNGSTMQDQINQIRGEEGTDVTLTIQRDGGEPFDVTITRAEITLQEVEARLIDGNVGYVELNGFSDASSQQFREALADLIDDGATRIVFDLRDNPGGYIEAAQEVASQFIEEGLIFSQESAGNDVREWRATGDGVATDPGIPLVVLVNGGSASASEIVAAALQESGRATIIGEPTFGKDTVQVWSRLENDGGVRITISRWFTPGHNSVAPNGIQPDIGAARTAETPPDEDVALDRALAFLSRPGVGAEAEPDEPDEPDPSPPGSPSGSLQLPVTLGVVPLHRFC